jgi:hypothetical protein
MSDQISAEQGWTLGRIVDPVRAAALTNAVELLIGIDITEFRPDDDLPGLAVLWAERFEAWLAGPNA